MPARPACSDHSSPAAYDRSAARPCQQCLKLRCTIRAGLFGQHLPWQCGQPAKIHAIHNFAESPIRNKSATASKAKNTQTKPSTSQISQSIASVRPERGYSVKIYDRSMDTWPASLRGQFRRKYVRKKVGNSEGNWEYQEHHTIDPIQRLVP